MENPMEHGWFRGSPTWRRPQLRRRGALRRAEVVGARQPAAAAARHCAHQRQRRQDVPQVCDGAMMKFC